MSSIADPIKEGLARGWKVHGGAQGPLPATLDCDVVIIGSGAWWLSSGRWIGTDDA